MWQGRSVVISIFGYKRPGVQELLHKESTQEAERQVSEQVVSAGTIM